MPKMDQIVEIKFDNVYDFLSYIPSALITRDHNFGFRGHRSSDWSLTPTLVRFVDEVQASYPDRQDRRELTTEVVVKRLHDEFRKNLIINNDIPQEEIDRMDIWQYGQHFGLPSPLLDWTYSPYVALFFALSERGDIQRSGSRCVWGINLGLISHINSEVVRHVWPSLKEKFKPDEFLHERFPTLDIVQDINQYNRRQAFQQGFFTRHVYYVSLEVWLKHIVAQIPHNSTDHAVLTKYIFPCSEGDRVSMLDKLDKMNINNRTLFPDIAGSVKDAIDSTFRWFQTPRFRHMSFRQDRT